MGFAFRGSVISIAHPHTTNFGPAVQGNHADSLSLLPLERAPSNVKGLGRGSALIHSRAPRRVGGRGVYTPVGSRTPPAFSPGGQLLSAILHKCANHLFYDSAAPSS